MAAVGFPQQFRRDCLGRCVERLHESETHNSPSALDPYGGAMTGIVGVNRDILGTGLGARPIANTDVFCFGRNWEGDLPSNLFHPSRVLQASMPACVWAATNPGIPTVNGAIVFDDRYIGKPLVYCGTVGLMPATLPDGRPGHAKTAEPGDWCTWWAGDWRRRHRRDLFLAGADRTPHPARADGDPSRRRCSTCCLKHVTPA